MPTPTTHTHPPRPVPTLHVALDLGNTSWCLAGAQAVAALCSVPDLRSASRPRRVQPGRFESVQRSRTRLKLQAA
jgi:hypothetical protein